MRTKGILLKILLIYIFIAGQISLTYGEIRLPKLISNGMIIQREQPIKLWGWANPQEAIKVKMADRVSVTQADALGKWEVILPPLQAGGPYEIEFKATNSIIITDVWVGDVWLCSGQSNMELPMRRVSWVYPEEIKMADYPLIRYFDVPKKYNFNNPLQDFHFGEWKKITPKEVLNFSAVAFFFASSLYKQYGVPIGIVNASLGGSPLEAWMSEESLKNFPKYYQEAVKYRDTSLILSIEQSDKSRISSWYKELQDKDRGRKEKGNEWYRMDIDESGWEKYNLPGYWNPSPLGTFCGVVWFRKEFYITDSLAGKPALLILGRIVDADSVFLNGTFIGTTSYQYPPRRYNIPEGLLQRGRNVLVVKIISNQNTGGFVPDKPYEIDIQGASIDLKGEWLYQIGAQMEPLASQTFIQWKPMGLYNAMIAPLLNFQIKGILWYQGESNVTRAREYESLLTSMIQDWRNKFNNPDLPFIIIQLPNFLEPSKDPSESEWALLREAQLKASQMPHAALVVTIDAGEWNDIHPLNKKVVGERSALAARRLAYHDNSLEGYGPQYSSMKIVKNKVYLTFNYTDGGLTTTDGKELKGFAIAGEDKKFVWAKAIIEGNQVVLWNDKVKKPVAIRYAWADNPKGANLCNKEGLLASPFRTDNW